MDKFIDKLIYTRWFMKVVALILALLLFDSVYDADKEVTDINVPGEEDTEVIADVPVKSYYDTENLVVSGIPETVDLSVKGPKSHLQPAKIQRNFEVYVDLSDAELGSDRVPIKIRDISDKLKVTIEPAYADVTIQEKVTKEFKVDAEFNKSLLEAGYTSEEPNAEPGKVKITGAKDLIDRISFVKATLDIRGPVTETVKGKANILVLDRDMNKLDVLVEPEYIEVSIPVKRLSKTVPINIEQKGEPKDNVTIDKVSLDVKEATITGSAEVLEKTENVRVEVDVSKIKEDTELTLPVIISEGISEVNPKTVKVKVKVIVSGSETEKVEEEEQGQDQDQAQSEDKEKEENKTFSNLPIDMTGLSDQYDAALVEPSSGKTSLTITGKSEVVQKLKSNDFNLFLNLANLDAGDHEVEINVNGPSNVTWNLAEETAKISITEKEV